MFENPVIVISGPTACGKSRLAVDLAKKIGGVIINCDSMQIYKGIPIVSAAPTTEERNIVEHRLFEIYDCDKRGNVVDWAERCVSEIRSLWKENKVPVVVGGTGMYIEALVYGVTPIPATPPEIRQKVNDFYKEKGLAAVYEYLKIIDKDSAEKLNCNDKSRIMRAVEIYEAGGRKISEWYKVPKIKKLPEAEFLIVKIFPPIDEIEARCRQRLDKMVNEMGALKEITDLLALNIDEDMPAMKALGVPELACYIKGKMSLDDALAAAKLHTRQYAKRQRTWLKSRLKADIEFDSVYGGQPDYLQQILNKVDFK